MFVKNKYSCLILCLFFSVFIGDKQVKGQLLIDNGQTPQQLVQNVLVGSGVNVSNITFTGAPLAIAKFSGNTNLGLDSGIVLTTGTTVGAEGPQGPNNSKSAGLDNGQPGDPYLSGISGNVTFNAASLEFDFVPASDTVKFRYVFGSEEYHDYVCGTVNDAFAFVISGVSVPLTATNMALIPGTTTPVSINTVNNGSVGTTGSINNKPCDLGNSKFFIDNGVPPGQTIQYNGFTTVLTATYPVQCGETYHLKMAIADGGDAFWDSGVFIEAQSLTSQNRVKVSSAFSLDGNDTSLYEGCGYARVYFERGSSKITEEETIYLRVIGVVQNGVDINLIPDSILLAPGTKIDSLDIIAISDGLPEGFEQLILIADILNPCNSITSDTISLYIRDVDPIIVTAYNDTTLLCPNQNVALSAIASGGLVNVLGNYNFAWSTGESGANISVSPNSTTTYVVTATDTCGTEKGKDSVTITFNNQPLDIVASGDASICSGNPVTLNAFASGGQAAYDYEWNHGLGNQNIQTIFPPATANYVIVVTDSCGTKASDTVFVKVLDPSARFTLSHNTNSNISFTSLSSGDSIVSYHWEFGDNSNSVQQHPDHQYADTGTYNVLLVITNTNGCTDTIEGTVIVRPDLRIYIPNAFTPNKDGLNDVFYTYGQGIAEFDITIYDRWGVKIFHTDNPTNGWDGNKEGKPVQQDVYVYVIKIKGYDTDAEEISKIGSIVLIR